MAAVTRTLVLLLGALTAFSPLTIDMYLPSLPAIAADFRVSAAVVQLSLSSYFIGLAIGQALYGPLSDAYGRRWPLAIGTTVYIAASVGCALAPNAESLIGLRFVQALGGCAGMVIARAVVRDLTSGQESARLFSSLMLVMGVAPILAPLAGGYMLQFVGWRAIFVFLGSFGLACLITATLRLPETLPPALRRPSGVGTALASYAALLRDRRFMGYTLAGGVAFATMFVYITASAQLFIGTFHFTPTAYAWLFGTNAAGLIGASQLNRRLLRRFTLYTVLRHALTVHAAAALTFLGVALAGAPLPVLIPPLFLTIASLGLVGPNGSAASLSGEARMAGAASSLMGTVPFIVGAGAGALVGALPGGSAVSLAGVMAACAVFAWTSHRVLVGPLERLSPHH